jgi:hypothetical protein
MTSVTGPRHFYAAPGKYFDTAPASTVLNSTSKFLNKQNLT